MYWVMSSQRTVGSRTSCWSIIFHSGPTGMSGLLRRRGVKDSPYALPAVPTLVLCLSSTVMEESWVRPCFNMLHPSDGIYVMSETRPSLFFSTSPLLCIVVNTKRGRPENKPSNRQSWGLNSKNMALNSSPDFIICSSFCSCLLTLRLRTSSHQSGEKHSVPSVQYIP